MNNNSNSNSNNDDGSNLGEYEVIIVGAGLAGASAAHHLTVAGVQKILVIDGGLSPGEGSADSLRKSGTAIMPTAPTIKMMVQVFATDSRTFVSHHGRKGAQRYLAATNEGLQIQKKLAKRVLEFPQNQLKELGSFYVGYQEDEQGLRHEYETLKALGGSSCTDIEWYDKERLRTVDGCPPDFYCAIFFPRDAVIDSSSYAKGLLRVCESKGSTRLMMNTHVTRVTEQESEVGTARSVAVELASGNRLRSRHVVMATGGLSQVPELCGIIKPCYSYLVHVPVDQQCPHACETSSNFFTWGFSHDWCFTQGRVRNSGEDHFSAYKDTKAQERCGNLIRWTLEKYGCNALSSYDEIPQQYGVYSETPDHAPLIGTLKGKNGSSGAICYLLGCNAWGQTILSYSSSLAPGLLGYKPLTDSQRDLLNLLSIRRFSHLPQGKE